MAVGGRRKHCEKRRKATATKFLSFCATTRLDRGGQPQFCIALRIIQNTNQYRYSVCGKKDLSFLFTTFILILAEVIEL